MKTFDRITVDAAKMGGVPCIRGLRIPVATVLGLLADGLTQQSLLDEYPDLEDEDIHQALGYAAYLARERDIPLTAAS
jgi:uncharacterized protein (DUF433 family)